MNNVKEMIENFDYIRLEVVDAWQVGAVYIAYKKEFDLNLQPDIKEDSFFKELDKIEYEEFKNKIKEFQIENWLNDYNPSREDKNTNEYSWKLIIEAKGKKAVKKGNNSCPECFEKFEDLMISLTYREDEI